MIISKTARRIVFISARILLLVSALVAPTSLHHCSSHQGPASLSARAPATSLTSWEVSYESAFASPESSGASTGVANGGKGAKGKGGLARIFGVIQQIGGGVTGAAVGFLLLPTIFIVFYLALMTVITTFYLSYVKRILNKLSGLLASFVANISALVTTAMPISSAGAVASSAASRIGNTLAPKRSSKDLAARSKRQVNESALAGAPSTELALANNTPPAPAVPPRHTAKDLAARSGKAIPE